MRNNRGNRVIRNSLLIYLGFMRKEPQCYLNVIYEVELHVIAVIWPYLSYKNEK